MADKGHAPPGLLTAHALERAAVTTAQKRQARLVTNRLIVAARAAGWKSIDLAAALGINPSGITHRSLAADAAPLGVDIGRPSPAPLTANDGWLGVNAAAHRAGVTGHTLYMWRRAGRLPSSQRPTNAWFYRVEELDAAAHRRTGRGQVTRW